MYSGSCAPTFDSPKSKGSTASTRYPSAVSRSTSSLNDARPPSATHDCRSVGCGRYRLYLDGWHAPTLATSIPPRRDAILARVALLVACSDRWIAGHPQQRLELFAFLLLPAFGGRFICGQRSSCGSLEANVSASRWKSTLSAGNGTFSCSAVFSSDSEAISWRTNVASPGKENRRSPRTTARDSPARNCACPARG